MNDKVSLIGGSLLIISAMTMSGVVINSSAAGLDQSANVLLAQTEVLNRRTLPLSSEAKARLASSTEAKIAADSILVPREALKRICGLLPAPQDAKKPAATKEVRPATAVDASVAAEAAVTQ